MSTSLFTIIMMKITQQEFFCEKRKGETITQAWEKINNTFKKSRVAPLACALDNETSKDLIDGFKSEITQHRAIRTFTSHFKACLAIVDTNFSLVKWNRSLDQESITLNLL